MAGLARPVAAGELTGLAAGLARAVAGMHRAGVMPSITVQYLKGGPEYTVFAKETETARARTQEYGVNYPKVSQAIWTAIQAAITGTMTPSAALQQAQATISSIPKVGGG